ncbi:TPA: TetR/AcrR family transcriptional regulator [Pseudomonas aeruginosa]|nr:TetR/AcrR family transcriptional regulator [Pseudomonas aeruginosa]EKF7419578.1 TetR/AcrR family transcriptional regulator [Pseudomonas aeruginosa]EKU0390468.1 TetR/AcrR family transcriptional regulator [Pseudomonas aeruginosa]EKV6282800.1 TetR/AcrR family transcriptional regulator [Pseudomonas aeruginosa]EKW1685590.1 TetR/AcrR family transcriptional regulator [Pseudomonas aeruginosa]
MLADKKNAEPSDDAVAPSSARAKQTRERILQAARDVVVQEGANRLTIDAVVARACLSKGAFLYHFKTKRDLLLTLIDDQVHAFDSSQEERERKFAGDPDPWLSSQVASMPNNEMEKLGAALLAAVAEDPTLLEPIRAWYRRQYARARISARSVEVAALVLVALDGAFFAEMMGFPTLELEERHRLLRTLQGLASGELELIPSKQR